MDRGGQRVRVGMQKPIFSTRDWFDGLDAFFMGGHDAYKTMAERAGHVPTRDLGIAYRLAPADLWSADLQVMNGTGDKIMDDNAGKDFSGRASLDLPVGLGVQASGHHGMRGDDSTDSISQVDLAASLKLGGLRALVEGLYGSASEADASGEFAAFQGALAGDIPLSAERLDHLALAGRFMFYDPLLELGVDKPYPDAWWVINAAGFLHWDVAERQHLLTGLVYENYAPQNDQEPLEHSLVAQAIWKY